MICEKDYDVRERMRLHSQLFDIYLHLHKSYVNILNTIPPTIGGNLFSIIQTHKKTCVSTDKFTHHCRLNNINFIRLTGGNQATYQQGDFTPAVLKN